MKKSALTIPALIGSILIFSFLAWAFNQHGTIGLYRINGILQRLFLILGFSGLALLLLVLLYRRIESRLKPRGRHRLSILIILLSLPAIIAPTVAFSYVNDPFSSGIGDTPPQLIIADGVGAYGIPDIAVVFNTESATANMLTWGEEDAMTTLEEEQLSKQHVFMLSDLKPNSKYSYKVNSDPAVYFNTPPAGETLHFAVASDTHFGASTARNDLTAQMLAEISDTANDFDMFFFLGDLVEHGFTNTHWQQAFETFAPTTSIIPVRFTVGNHDTLFSGFSNYKNYCYPEGMELQTGSQLWYRIDTGKVHFLILDLEWSAESFTANQAEWLEAQLKSIPADDWKIVMSHGFYYSSGLEMHGWNWYDNPETIEQLTPLFEEYKVDLVCSGHNHHLELLENSGIIYTICGAFGGLPNPERTYTSPSSLWYRNGGYGFIDITISGNECTLIFRNPDYEAIKTYTFDKRS
jgi:UDP-2,3-diacylglucosamine pyrophosphatase LpxH